MTTQSEPTGTTHIDIEVFIGSTRATFATIRGFTLAGRVWMERNMVGVNHNGMVRVARETVHETVELIRQAGLKVNLP